MQYADADIKTILIVMFTTLAASSGFWAFLSMRRDKHSATTKLLMGLAHDKIMTNGMRAIRRGHIQTEEYEDLRKYLYDPYIKLGGNGIVERVMNEVSKLPLVHPGEKLEKEAKNEQIIT